jgi:serine/threonine-protein kinase
MDVSAATWNTLSKLLDEALDLEPDARAAWIDDLGTTQPQLAPVLRRLLAAHASSETSDLLQGLPTLDVTVDANDATGLEPGSLVGPYRLKRELGSGGMADVWLAERADGAFEREVALKLPRLSRLRRDLAERFARERDILARLEHPHIARFYDAGVSDDSLPYLAIEYVNGQPITQWCNERRLAVAARLELFAQVLEAVQFAHANLVIHRDLKPSNIPVTEEGQVRLLDFGIAKLLSEEELAHETRLTQFAGRVLTPDYASPEQIKGEPLTTATDIYSLGVVLYELIVGRLPYHLKLQSAAQLEEAIVAADPARPSGAVSAESAEARGASASRLRRALRGDLDTVVLKALAKEPAQRYATVAELADDLRRHLVGKTVRARPPSWGYRTRKFIRRNRVAVGAAAAITLALIAATGVSVWQARRAEEQALRAHQEATRAEEVKNFVLSIFADADTARGGSRSTTALDLLRQARERLKTAQVTDPSITAELLNSVGYSLIGLGETAEAIPVLEQGVQLSAAHLGPDHPTTISTHINLGEAYLSTGDIAGAERVFGAALTSARRSGDVRGHVKALRWLGSVRAEQGDIDGGLKYAMESVRLADADLGHDKHEVMLAHWQAAAILWRTRSKESLAAVRRTYELAQEYWGGRPTPDVLAARSFYAVVLGYQGDAQTAIAELRAVREEQLRLFGSISYPDVIFTNERIALASLMLGDPLAAVAGYREVIRGVTEKAGGGSPIEIAKNQMRLGGALMDARRFDEAERELRQAHHAFESLKNPNVVVTRRLLAGVMTRDGRLEEAEAMLAPLIAQPPSSNPRDLAPFKWRLGQLRSAQARHEEAVSLLREAQALFVESGAPSEAAVALATLGAAQLAAGNASHAVATLQRADMLLDKLHPHGSPDHADLLIDLARAQLALGRAREAVVAAAQADEFWKQFDAQNRQAGLAALWHARALLAQGQAQQADESWKRASVVLAKAALPPDRKLLTQTGRELQASSAIH